MTEFSLQGRPFVPLHNLLQLEGLCDSGGAAKQQIALGRVRVDGQLELRKRCKIKAGQRVEFAGQAIQITA